MDNDANTHKTNDGSLGSYVTEMWYKKEFPVTFPLIKECITQIPL